MSEQHQQWYQLFGALCNGTITPSQHEQLQEILSKDAQARQLYFQYLDVHLELGQADHNPLMAGEGEIEGKEATVAASIRKSKTNSKSVWPISLIAVALLAMVVVTTDLWVQDSDLQSHLQTASAEQNLFASVVQTSQVRFAESSPTLRVGAALELQQQYALTEGELQLLFESGAEVILKGPAVFELAAKETLSVDYGTCSVHAPAGAEGFVVKTPLSRVVDLGTRFSVNVTESGETDVQVIEGEAEVHSVEEKPIVNRQAVRLTEGMARRYIHDHQIIEKEIPFDQARYSSRLPDRIVKYSATTGPHGGAENLKSVTVQRGGKQLEYQVEQLIGIEVTHFKGVPFGRGYLTTGLDETPETLGETFGPGLLDADTSLTTGLINPGGNVMPLYSDAVINSPEKREELNTPGLAIKFRSPVVNGPGPDIVLFDLHIIVHPVHGDQFHVSPLEFKAGLRTHTIRKFDINLSSAEALMIDQFKLYIFKDAVNSLDQLKTTENNGGMLHTVRAKALATGIDLSDLGYQHGEKVSELFIQDAMAKGGHLDPVFIAGFPPLD